MGAAGRRRTEGGEGLMRGKQSMAEADCQAESPAPAASSQPAQLRYLPPKAVRLDPNERLTRAGKQLADPSATVGDFWSWAFSDLRQNSVRGHLAEYIVAKALSVILDVRSAWDDYDLLLIDLMVPRHGDGSTVGRRTPARVQVKSSGYLQAWPQNQLSQIIFSGLRSRPFPFNAEGGAYKLGGKRVPKADVFVFAIHTAKTHDTYSALDVGQWEFRVLPAQQITQTSLGYPSLCRMTTAETFDTLALAVARAARERIQKLAGAMAQIKKAKQRNDTEALARWQAIVAELEA